MEDKTKETLDHLDKGKYTNNKEVTLGNRTFNVRDLVLKAPLIAGLNVYCVGGTGEGKTQIAHDLASYFGDSYCYAIGRPDFEPRELFEHVRLDRLREALTDSELVELTNNIGKNVFYVDELNRCPPVVQNYFFDLFDGKLVHRGKILRLGKQGYSVGFATGNLGDGSYVGISDSDRALKDRMHLIVKLDHPNFATTELDDFEIFGKKLNPRTGLPEQSGDISDRIIKLNQEFQQRKVDPLLPALGVFLTKGLDYLEDTAQQSKRAVELKWPRLDGIRQDTDESKIFPLSKRGILSAICLAQSLEMIAESNGTPIETGRERAELFLDSLRLTIPYSGVLAPDFVAIEHNGDVYSAFDAVMEKNKADALDKVEFLEEALLLAEAGHTDKKLLDKVASDTEGKWLPVRRAVTGYAEKRKVEPSETGLTLVKMLREIK